MRKQFIYAAVLLLVTVVAVSGCKKSESSTSTSAGDKVLAIQTGARSTAPDQPLNYKAVLVDKEGKTSDPSSVEWSVAVSGGGSIGSFSGSGASTVFTPTGIGYGTISAKVTINGKTLTAQAPVAVAAPTLFAVVPSAVIWTTNAGTIDLNPVYIGTEKTGYSYSSTDANIADVNSSGEITFKTAGQCAIKVKATGLSGQPEVIVPVLVTGVPSVPLPVTRVSVTPPSKEMFRGGNLSLAAKAFNSSGAEVATTFTWQSSDPGVANVDATGKVTATSLGKAVITATGSGITGQAEIEVLPDTAIILTPYWASIAPSKSQAFSAKTYRVDHSSLSLTEITNPELKWSIPTYGISLFDIATVNAAGVVSMKSSALVGLATIVMAEATSPTIQPGVAMITVSDCDCGTTTAGVASIKLNSPASVSLTITATPTASILAQAVDGAGNPVSGATLKYCSNTMTVCTVDDSGQITAVAPGTSTITVCNGSVSTTVTVNVSL